MSKLRFTEVVYMHCPAGCRIEEATEQFKKYLEKNPKVSVMTKWSGGQFFIANTRPEIMLKLFREGCLK